MLPVKHGRVQVIVAASAACGLRLRSDEKRETGFWRSANSPTQRFRFSKTYFPTRQQRLPWMSAIDFPMVSTPSPPVETGRLRTARLGVAKGES